LFLSLLSRSDLVIYNTGESSDLEIVKARFAQVVFVGLITTFIFSAILYFLSPEGSGPGQVIFDKAATAMTPLASVIIGYLFGRKTDTANPIARKIQKPLLQAIQVRDRHIPFHAS
jgi:hypothetical protein